MPALQNIHLNVDEDIAKKIADKKYAEIVIREEKARISAIIKCAIDSSDNQTENEQVMEKVLNNLGTIDEKSFVNDSKNVYKELKKLQRGFLEMKDTTRQTVSFLDNCFNGINSLKVLQVANTAISFSNLITTASGIVILSNKLDGISKDLGEVSRRIDSLEHKMDQALNRQKNEIIVEYKGIVKHYYTMAMRISDKHDIDPLDINELIITISSFIEKMLGNLIDDAFDRELAISMMYSLVNPYASLIREYIIRYFCLYEKIPANYVDHLETFNAFLDDDFCNKVKECYFIDKGMSNRTSVNTFNAEVMGITNSVTKIRDIKDLLQQLKTKENYLRFSESLDEEVRRCAEEYYGTVAVS